MKQVNHWVMIRQKKCENLAFASEIGTLKEEIKNLKKKCEKLRQKKSSPECKWKLKLIETSIDNVIDDIEFYRREIIIENS